MTETPKRKFLQGTKHIEWKTTAIYTLAFLLVILPFYNWFYRNFVNILHIWIFFISVFLILFSLIQNVVKGRLKKALLCMGLGAIILYAGLFAHDVRYVLTDYIIREYYCDTSRKLESELILGGIREMWTTESPERTGAFENSSHCLFVSCLEEFYYCSDAKIEIYR